MVYYGSYQYFFFFLSIPVELRNTFLFVLETKPSSN
jgi:hypothetical protein